MSCRIASPRDTREILSLEGGDRDRQRLADPARAEFRRGKLGTHLAALLTLDLSLTIAYLVTLKFYVAVEAIPATASRTTAQSA